MPNHRLSASPVLSVKINPAEVHHVNLASDPCRVLDLALSGANFDFSSRFYVRRSMRLRVLGCAHVAIQSGNAANSGCNFAVGIGIGCGSCSSIHNLGCDPRMNFGKAGKRL